MRESIAYLLIGLGAGAFYAMLASGVVVAFKGSGVINFAHGAMAMFVAFQFHYLRTKSRLQLPWVDFLPFRWLNVPVTIKFDAAGGKMSFLPAFVLAMLTSILLGVMAHFLVFRPLRNAAPLGKVIGSLGIMLYLQGVALKNFGSDNPNPKAVFPDGIFRNFLGLGKPMPKDGLAFAAFAIVIAAGLWLFFQYTRFGLATRAAAGNEKGAVLLGYSPERLALSNWILSAVLAGLAGVFVGSITGALNPVKYTGLIVPALGAALIGRLSSIPLAAAGGLALGMLDSWTTTWLTAPSRTWWPSVITSGGAKDALPLLVIVVVLIVRGKSLPIRGTVEEKRLPLSPYPKRVWQWVLIAGSGAIMLSTGLPGGFLFHGLTGVWALALTTSLITSMVMLGYVVLTGYIGQISIAQMSIAGVAAFITSRFMANGLASDVQPFPVRGLNWPWPPAALGGIIAAVLVGVLVGLPAVRIRGVQLAVVTIAAAVGLQTLYFENDHLTDLRAGSNAIVKDPTFFGLKIGAQGKGGLTDNPRFTIFCVVVLAGLCVMVSNLRRSGTGRRFLAVRANERAAAAVGIEVPRTKLLAFALASGIAGVGGIMTGFQQRQVSSAGWVFGASLGVLAFAYIGGITSVNGALIGGLAAAGGLAAVFGNYHNPGFTPYVALLGGLGLILTAIIQPGGQAPFIQPGLQYFGRWLTTGPIDKFPKAVIRVVPGMIPGVAIAWWLIIIKAREWRNWHLLVLLAAGLVGRNIGLEIYRGVKAKRSGAPMPPRGPVPPSASSDSTPALAEA